VGSVVFNVKNRSGSAQAVAGGEYNKGISQTIIVTICSTGNVWEETRWWFAILH